VLLFEFYRILKHQEANGDIQAHTWTFRGLQWHVENTGEFREIHREIGEYRVIKENKIVYE
jgi:hypothetical protein